MRGIRISDMDDRSVLAFDLVDILKHMDGSRFEWRILYFYGVAKADSNISIPGLEEEANESPDGLSIRWEDLKTLAQQLEQVYDITLIGCIHSADLRRFEDDETMYRTCDVVVEFLDCAYCIVYSKDSEFLRRLSTAFSEVETLNR